MKKNILVLCTGNSCRSQLAEGYLRDFHGEIANVYSAGVETHGVNHVDEYLDIPFDLIFTVCDHASERCPVFPSSAQRIHHNFTDPAKATGTEVEIMAEFRRVREEIKEFCRMLEV